MPRRVAQRLRAFAEIVETAVELLRRRLLALERLAFVAQEVVHVIGCHGRVPFRYRDPAHAGYEPCSRHVDGSGLDNRLRQDHADVILASPRKRSGGMDAALCHCQPFLYFQASPGREWLAGHGSSSRHRARVFGPACSMLRLGKGFARFSLDGHGPRVLRRAAAPQGCPMSGERKRRRNQGGTMEKKSTDLQHVVFETEEAGRVEAMWSSLRLNGQDVPDGWHRYAVRGGDDGWEPCSIEPFVWVNHTADIITPVDLELDKHDRMLTIRDWWFDDEPFPAE
ncbi:hypothetical protein BBB_1194 [Bifidobacterium bifidum BGN4]|uniref:Large polyvalent protein associated domain-containing protein n=3 Tax=Bifidobacterium bifidum TaxID=1681 RepID=I3WIS3_BIFBI|nr:hypothetical protein BBB_1194 [Bifidobacterium bifidum BGN4]